MTFLTAACAGTTPGATKPETFTPNDARAMILIGVVDAPDEFSISFNPYTGSGPRERGAIQTYGVHFSTVSPEAFELGGERVDDAPVSHAVMLLNPGRYVMTALRANDGIFDEGVSVNLCMGTVTFQAYPGAVTYVGDFAVRRAGEDGRTTDGVQFLDADLSAAERFLAARPDIIAPLRKAEVDKTVFLPPGERDGPCVRRFYGR